MRPTNSGIMPYLFRSSEAPELKSSASACFLLRAARRGNRARACSTLRDDVGQPDERAAEDEQDVRRVDGDEPLLGCLRPPWGGTLASQPRRS